MHFDTFYSGAHSKLGAYFNSRYDNDTAKLNDFAAILINKTADLNIMCEMTTRELQNVCTMLEKGHAREKSIERLAKKINWWAANAFLEHRWPLVHKG